jgi:uncharacterized membrane protein (DUF373 family)
VLLVGSVLELGQLDKKSGEIWGAGVRNWIARQFTRVEDVVYVSLGVLLAGCAVVLLVAAASEFVTNLAAGTLAGRVVEILDRILLVLMVVEILYTVQVSFRGQTLVPEPFLIVGVIAAIRRILILTAEFKDLLQKGDTAFRNGMIELGLLGLLIVGLVISIVLLQKRGSKVVGSQ